MENKNNNININFEKFAKHITPLPTEGKEKNHDKLVKWGDDNLYPYFLIQLSKESALHGAILQSKTNYVYGDGVVELKSAEVIGDNFQVNEEDTLSDLIRKCINDVVYFSGFAVKVEFNVLGQPLHYSHVPFHHVRSNRSKTKFFVNEDWFNNPRTYMSYDKYNPKYNEDTNAKIFYFTSYNISVNNVYPSVDYHCIEDVVTDTLISQLFKTNIGNGFSLTKVVSIIGAIPDEATKRRATQKFKDVFSGVEGEGFLLDFATEKDKTLSIDTIPADDYASKIIEVIKKIERNILSAHGATSSLLFGVEKEGSLGNSSELEVAYSLFKDNYVKDKRIEIIGAFNKLFQSDDRLPIIDLKDKTSLFKKELDGATKQRILTVNELRKEAGYQPIEGGDVVLDAQSSTNESFSSKKKDDEEVEGRFATPEDFEKVKHLGASKDEFIVINSGKVTMSSCGHYHFNSDYKSIEEYLLDNKINDMTLDEATIKIGNELGYSVSKQSVKDAIDLLKNAGLIDVKTNTQTNKIWTAPTAIVNSTTIEVYYDYQKRPEADGNIKIPTTRHFCESIIDSNKYFSAKDIQSFSAVLGYDVMQYCGGYWHNKKTGVTNKFCRHQWTPVRVIKK